MSRVNEPLESNSSCIGHLTNGIPSVNPRNEKSWEVLRCLCFLGARGLSRMHGRFF